MDKMKTWYDKLNKTLENTVHSLWDVMPKVNNKRKEHVPIPVIIEIIEKV